MPFPAFWVSHLPGEKRQRHGKKGIKKAVSCRPDRFLLTVAYWTSHKYPVTLPPRLEHLPQVQSPRVSKYSRTHKQGSKAVINMITPRITPVQAYDWMSAGILRHGYMPCRVRSAHSYPFLLRTTIMTLSLHTEAVFGCLYHGLVPSCAHQSFYHTAFLRQTSTITHGLNKAISPSGALRNKCIIRRLRPPRLASQE